MTNAQTVRELQVSPVADVAELPFEGPVLPASVARFARQLAQREAVDRLAHARRRRVGRGRHVAVVAPVVFDEEVPISCGCQHQLGQPALKRVQG